jgi:DNA-binding winged helix-turn-helix (wHTH) protein
VVEDNNLTVQIAAIRRTLAQIPAVIAGSKR